MTAGARPMQIVITGASSGIGAAAALRIARRTGPAVHLVLVARDEVRLRGVVDACASHGTASSAIVADLLTTDGLSRVTDLLCARAPVAALVNNAGVGCFGATQDFARADWDRLLGLNLTACFELSKAVLSGMVSAGAGTIVNVGSDADSIGFTGAATYCASKAGLLGLTRALAVEYQPRGIRIGVVSAGRVDTCFNGKQPGMRPGALSANDVAEVIEFSIFCSPNIELSEVRLESLSRGLPHP